MRRGFAIFLTVSVSALLALYAILLAYDKFKKPTYIRNFGEYSVGMTGSLFNGLCGIEKVWKIGGAHSQELFRYGICEDNVETIYSEGDWIVLRTSCGRELRKNIVTDEQIYKDDSVGKCFGGGISFE